MNARIVEMLTGKTYQGVVINVASFLTNFERCCLVRSSKQFAGFKRYMTTYLVRSVNRTADITNIIELNSIIVESSSGLLALLEGGNPSTIHTLTSVKQVVFRSCIVVMPLTLSIQQFKYLTSFSLHVSQPTYFTNQLLISLPSTLARLELTNQQELGYMHRHVVRFPNLQILNLASSNLDNENAVCRALAHHNIHLQELYISNHSFNYSLLPETLLERLSCVKMTNVLPRGCAIPKLTNLDISFTHIAYGFDFVEDTLNLACVPRLESLKIVTPYGAPSSTYPDELARRLSKFVCLRTLSLNYYKSVSYAVHGDIRGLDVALPFLICLETLELGVGQSFLNWTPVVTLLASDSSVCPNLSHFSIIQTGINCKQFSLNFIHFLKSRTLLKTLRLASTFQCIWVPSIISTLLSEGAFMKLETLELPQMPPHIWEALVYTVHQPNICPYLKVLQAEILGEHQNAGMMCQKALSYAGHMMIQPLTWQQEQEQLRERRRTALEQRIRSLRSRLRDPFDSKSIPEAYRKKVLGDFFEANRLKPQQSLKTTVLNIRSYKGYAKQSGPKQLFLYEIYCQDPTLYQVRLTSITEVGGKRDRVFEQEWNRISAFLGQRDSRQLAKVSPVFAMARNSRFRATKKVFDAAIKQHSDWLEDDIFHSSMNSCRRHIQRLFKQRFERDIPPQAFHKIFEEPIRKNLLETELEKRGLRLRSDSRFCAQFIEGTTTASVEEVVATMCITTFLFNTGGPGCWSENRYKLESHMREGMKQGRYTSWYQACDASMQLPLNSWQIYHHYDGWDDDWD